jgi:hypothetical protein
MKREFIKLVGGLPSVLPNEPSKQVLFINSSSEGMNMLLDGFGVLLTIQLEKMVLNSAIGKEEKMLTRIMNMLSLIKK